MVIGLLLSFSTLPFGIPANLNRNFNLILYGYSDLVVDRRVEINFDLGSVDRDDERVAPFPPPPVQVVALLPPAGNRVDRDVLSIRQVDRATTPDVRVQRTSMPPVGP